MKGKERKEWERNKKYFAQLIPTASGLVIKISFQTNNKSTSVSLVFVIISHLLFSFIEAQR